MKAPLKKCVIAMTGDFGKDRTHETLKRWIECNGGKVAKEIDSQVTHLLCTRHDFRKPVKMGKLNTFFFYLSAFDPGIEVVRILNSM